MDKEADIVKLLDKRLVIAQWSFLQVAVNVVTWNPLRSVAALLNVSLEVHTLFMERNDPFTDAEAAISHYNLPCAVKWLRHLHHCLYRLLKAIVLRWECPRPVCLLWMIFPFDQLDPKHYRLPTIPIGNCVVFIAKRVWFARHDHEARAELAQPRAHRLI